MNIEALKKRAEETSTTALLIWQDGKIITSFGEDKKVPLYSMTKSFVSLAIGFLFDEGKIQSLDTPVCQWFEEWRGGEKAPVTIRMLMTHTSGIWDHFIDPDGTFNVERFTLFKRLPNVVEAAMKLGLTKSPGSHASYSNSSADILVELVKRISTKRIDVYVNEKLFKPLAITNWEWVSSTKQLFGVPDDRNPSGADGLVLAANDLLKVGKMILQGGTYEGKQIISKKWIEMMSTEIPSNHLTMDLGAGAKEKYNSALLWMVPESAASKKTSECFMGWGFLGQYFMILPSKKMVAIRLYTEGLPDLADLEKNSRVTFADFENLVRMLLPIPK